MSEWLDVVPWWAWLGAFYALLCVAGDSRKSEYEHVERDWWDES